MKRSTDNPMLRGEFDIFNAAGGLNSRVNFPLHQRMLGDFRRQIGS